MEFSTRLLALQLLVASFTKVPVPIREFQFIESTTNESLTEIIEDESHQVTTVVIFVIIAVLVIILIFVMAVFIDCRQQKIQETRIRSLRKRIRRKIQRTLPTLPTVGEIPRRDDQQTIVENMEDQYSSAPAYVS